MALFYISFSTDGGYDLDWFVRAPSAHDAITAWLKELGEEHGFKGYTTTTRGEAQIFTVPDVDGPPGLISWPHDTAIRFTPV